MFKLREMALIALLMVYGATLWGQNIPETEAFQAAETLLSVRDYDTKVHSLARDNLAYFIIQGGKLRKLTKLLAKNDKARTKEVLACIQTKRWKGKVGRTLDSAGTNEAIAKRLAEIGGAFAKFSKTVAEKAAGAKYQFILSGSLVKGHFSAKSDVDLIIDTKSKELASWAMNSQWSTTVSHGDDYDEQVAIADAGDYTTMSSKLNLRLLGQTVAIDGEVYDEKFLAEFYVKAMDARGVKLEAESFAATYAEKNYLFKMKREMSIWMVSAIEQAKNFREAVASIFGKGESKASSVYVEALEPVDPETFLRSLAAERLHLH